MRTTVLTYSILLGFSQLMVAATGHGQALSKRMDVQIIKQRLPDALELLKANSQADFAYDAKSLAIEDIWVEAKTFRDATLEQVLATLLAGTSIDYKEEVQGSVTLFKPHKQGNVMGTVRDAAGVPLAGASIKVVELNRSFGTDDDGAFSFSIQPGTYTLEVTHLAYGMQRREGVLVEDGGRTVVDFVLQGQAGEIDEVVVVGYGVQRKSDVTGSIAVVSTDDINAGAPFNALQGLKGRAAGVNVFSNGSNNPLGLDGAPQRVVIRGLNSINTSTHPLYVVDGVQLNDIQFINPGDIERMEVLKDASATAIYGARGANGVILVTTKRGKSGSVEKTMVNYSGWLSSAYLAKKMEVMNAEEFMQMSDRAFANIGKYQQGRDYLRNNGITELLVDRSDPLIFDENGRPKYDTDWQEEATRNAWSQNHQVNIQHQGDRSSVGASVGYTDQQGILLNNYAKRLSGRIAYDAKPLDWLSVNTNLLINRVWGNGVEDIGGGLSAKRTMTEMVPILPVKFPDGRWANSQFEGNRLNFALENMTNPVHELTERVRNRTMSKMFGNVALVFHLADGLDLRTQFGVDVNQRKNKDYVPNNMLGISVRGNASISDQEDVYWQEETYLTYQNVFYSKHRLNVMAGTSWSKFSSQTLQVGVQDFDNNDFAYFNLGAGRTPSAPASGLTDWSMHSLFTRANYSFNDKYLATVTVRADGSSRFGENNKYGFFPSLGIGWLASAEGFMEHVQAVNHLKLRASYGRTGNTEIAPYLSLSTLASGTTLIGGNRAVTNQVSRMANPELKWEKTEQFDVGFELKMFENRIALEADYYYKMTSDLLLNRPLPITTGFESVMFNMGRVDNYGVDFSLAADPIRSANFAWESILTLNYNRNKIIRLGENDEDILTAPSFVGGNIILRVGEPLGSFYGYKRLGTWGTDEVDEAAKFNAVPGEAKRSENHQILGKGMPDWTGSFVNKFRYKQLDLVVDLQFVTGVQAWQLFLHTSEDRTGYTNGLKSILYDSWTETNQQTMVQQIRHRVYSGNNTTADSRWVSDGSYLRGNLVQLGYTFSNFGATRLGVRDLRVNLSANNVFIIHAKDFKGYDPEGTSSTDRFGQNVFFYQYPMARTFTLGVNVNF